MRAGRMTAGQEQGWQQGFPQFGLTVAQGALDWDRTFGSPGRRVLEIGFGMGDSLLQMAQAEPETQFVGIEVHRPGVGRLLSQALGSGIRNLRVYAEDAVDVLSHCVAPASLDAVHIFFPDPWHKKRHHKRRLIQSKFVGDFAHLIRRVDIFTSRPIGHPMRSICLTCWMQSRGSPTPVARPVGR